MSGLKYTPERAQQAANQRAHTANIIYKKNKSRRIWGIVGFIVVAVLLIHTVVVQIILPPVYEVKYADEKAAMLSSVCEDVYSFPYDSLKGFTLRKSKSIEVNQKEYSFDPKVEIFYPEKSDDIKDGVDYKKVKIRIRNAFWYWDIVEDYAAIPNEDGTFTLEPFDDFKKRMHK